MQQSLSIPLAIIVAGAFIAGALFFAGRSSAPSPTANNDGGDVTNNDLKNMDPVAADDHILGNPNADIVIVEYSDFECPFCKQFHITMQQIINEYGVDGRVAWVYRHFPITQLHSRAPKESEASECAWEQGGNEAFWAFADRIFEITPSNNGLDPARLPEIAADIGLNKETFNACLNSGKYSDKVESQFNDAIDTGGQGTPHSIIVTKAGQFIPLSGAQPYGTVKNVVETILAEGGGHDG